VLGEIETPNHVLDDLVLVRGDGRPTYNFASPVEDWLDGITHVIRGRDHISNTPRQINILRALGAEIPQYAHMPDVAGDDGKKLSKRHGAQGVDEFRDLGYLPETMLNFLALLGWSYDDRTTLMTRDELVERFSFERVGASPATFDYKKLDWMNGEYIRALGEDEFAHRLLLWLGEHGYEWDAGLVRKGAPLVQEKIKRLSEFPDYARFLFEEVEADPALVDERVLAVASEALEAVGEWRSDRIEAALRGLADRTGLKPAKAFQPIRVAVTGSKISPGLFESLELLGRETSLARINRARGAAAATT
jgi:glutamyl-tRNA synthetase